MSSQFLSAVKFCDHPPHLSLLLTNLPPLWPAGGGKESVVACLGRKNVERQLLLWLVSLVGNPEKICPAELYMPESRKASKANGKVFMNSVL